MYLGGHCRWVPLQGLSPRFSSGVKIFGHYHTLSSLYVCIWLVNTLTSTAPIGSPIICMWSPADIYEQWERNLSFGSADVSGAGTRDEPLRTSASEAIFKLLAVQLIQRTKRWSHFLSCRLQEGKNRRWKIAKSSSNKGGRDGWNLVLDIHCTQVHV